MLALALLVAAAVVVGIVVVVVRRGGSSATATPDSAPRLVTFGFLFLVLVIAATGVAGLIDRALPGGTPLAGSDVTGLARALAFTLIGVPVFSVIWLMRWRDIDTAAERQAIGWSLYVLAAASAGLAAGTIGLLTAIGSLIQGDPGLATGPLSIGVVWLGIWIWHWWMLHHPVKGPTGLEDVAIVLGSGFGLVMGAVASGALTADLAGEAYDRLTGSAVGGSRWWEGPLVAAMWAAAGVATWWWHWYRSGTIRSESVLRNILVVGPGLVVPAVVALGALAGIIYTATTWFVTDAGGAVEHFSALPGALAVGVVATVVWSYHRQLVGGSGALVRAATHLLAGAGLVAASVGVGVVVNALLATFGPTIAGETTDLLVSGIVPIGVGGWLWWRSWRPNRPAPEPSTARRIYLVAVFGVSALTALVSLIVVAFQTFEAALDTTAGVALIDEIRVAVGFLVASGIATAYHYPVWRRDRARIEAAAAPRRVGHLVLVGGAGIHELAAAVRHHTRAAVTVWHRTDLNGGEGPTAEEVAAALADLTADRALVLTGPGHSVQVVPLSR
jgi:hypothetical protein